MVPDKQGLHIGKNANNSLSSLFTGLSPFQSGYPLPCHWPVDVFTTGFKPSWLKNSSQYKKAVDHWWVPAPSYQIGQWLWLPSGDLPKLKFLSRSSHIHLISVTAFKHCFHIKIVYDYFNRNFDLLSIGCQFCSIAFVAWPPMYRSLFVSLKIPFVFSPLLELCNGVQWTDT